MPKIRVVIKKDGTSVVSVDGVAGPACKDLTKKLEEALGKVTSDENTSDFYEDEQVDRLTQY